MTVEAPLPPDESHAKAYAASAALAGPGISRAVPIAPHIQAQPGLAGPIRGVGGLASGMMQPQLSRPPVPQLSAPPVSYSQVVRLPQMPGFPAPMAGRPHVPPVQFAARPGTPSAPFPVPPPQFVQRPMGPAPSHIMRGPPPPQRLGMPPPPGGAIPVFASPRPGMPLSPLPNPQQQ